jgi:hypothetical protein
MNRPRNLIALVLLAVLAACQGPQKPEFRTLKNVKFRGAGRSGHLRLTADAVFHNPNPVGLEVHQIEAEVLLDGRKAADVRQGVNASMPAGAASSVPLTIEVPLTFLTEDGGSLLSDLLSQRKVLLQVAGWVEVDVAGVVLRVPFDHRSEEEIRL